MKDEQNIAGIRLVVEALGELAKDVVFVGGATVSLYKDKPAAEFRGTDDVDIVVEVSGYKGYAELEEKLRAKGFTNDAESKIIARYKLNGLIVDVLPTDGKILGFSNRWYPDGFKKSINYSIDDKVEIRIFSAAYFIASKLDAFSDRGKNDGRTSTDFEDIIYILNNRSVIWQELATADKDLQIYISDEFKKHDRSGLLEEWISCHLDYDEQNRLGVIYGGILAQIELQ